MTSNPASAPASAPRGTARSPLRPCARASDGRRTKAGTVTVNARAASQYIAAMVG
jgi:hypothetical protein